MKLKEKFEQVESPVAIQLEKIADDYAIEFAEWIETSEWNIKYWLHNNNVKELLEIFKKEKGL